MNDASPPSVAAQIAALPQLPMKALWSLWDRHFPRRPQHPNRQYLISRLAYKLQEAAYGGLPLETRTRLANIGQRYSKIRVQRNPGVYLAPGTVLLREFEGREYRVTVTPSGQYELNGQIFKSLSAVARHITGTQWSGPAFFGVRP